MAKAKKKSSPFEKLPRDEQAKRLRPFMAGGGSYRRAAKEFKTTIGRVAGLCRDYDIASTHPPAYQGSPEESKRVERPTPAPPPEPHEVQLPEPEGKPKPPYKLASMRHLACDATWEDGALCEYVHEEGSRYCKLHNWMRKHPRT